MALALHYARIAWSLGWGAIFLLLLTLYVRSYLRQDSLQVGKNSATSTHGRLLVNDLFMMAGPSTSSRTMTQSEFMQTFSRHEFANGHVVVSTARNGALIPLGVGKSIPLWPVVAAAVVFIVVPWIRWHFSLRTLLIAATLTAIVLGSAVMMLRGS